MTGKPHNNTNPRKFKEKIELLRQKEAQLTANFMEVMRGIPTLTRNVVTYSDLADKDLSPTANMSPSSRISIGSAKSAGGYTRGMAKSDSYQYTIEATSNTTSRSHYGNSGGLDSGGGGERVSLSNQISRTNESATDTHTQGRNREPSKARNWSRNQSNADSGDSGLASQISPLRGPQNSLSPSVSYQPNLASISVSPHSPSASSLPPTSSSSLPVPPAASQFYPSAEPSPSANQRQQFHPPAAPPPIQPTHSANHHTITADYGWGDSANPVDGESCAIPSGMSLMDYRRTYSDSCIPSSFAEPNRRFQQQSSALQYHQQQVQNQGPPYPPPPPQPQPVQTLPPVNELTFSRYQNSNNTAGTATISSNTTPITVGGSYFNGTGSSLSPRCRHQSSITVSHQYQQNPSWRKLQPDYHSMRNIPQRYAPLHHHHHHHQMMPMTSQQQSHQQQQQQLAAPEAMTMEGYESYGGGQNGVWGVNGNGNGFSASVRDLPSSMNTSRLRRSEVYNHFRSKQQPPQGQPLQPLPQMSSPACFDNRNITSSGSYYESTVVSGESLTSYHHQQHHNHHPLSTSALMCSTAGGTNGIIIPSSQPPLTQSLDICVLDSDAFPSPEQEGRRDSFSMAVDLLSRLEKRPLDTSSCNSTASPPVIQVAPAWSNSVSPPPSKSAKFDPSSTTVATSSTTPGPAFYVPIAEKDLQLLTEPSMVNYVTDAATEDQLVREQYSPG